MKTGTINDAKIKVQIVLGEKQLSVERLSSLREGSIIQVETFAGEPVQLLAGGEVIAEGEVVVIDENFGMRVTKLLTVGKPS